MPLIMESTPTIAAKDPAQYPLLRNLQFSPIKEGEEQYIVLWDPTGLSKERLVLPLNYFFIVQHLDGEHSVQDIGAIYLKRFGEFLMPNKVEQLLADLDTKLFLEGTRTEQAKQQALTAYRQAPARLPQFSGRSYEADAAKLRAQINGFFTSKEGPEVKASEHAGKLIKGLVAPTYELKHAGPIYAWAYKELQEAQQPDLYVLIGTAYSGLEQPVAMTDKDFETPLGLVKVERTVTDRLREQIPSAFTDELAHHNEHALEFQLPFLQESLGKDRPFTIVPILTSFSADSLRDPQIREQVETFLQALKDALVATGKTYCVVVGAELAHIGMRYGDSAPPTGRCNSSMPEPSAPMV